MRGCYGAASFFPQTFLFPSLWYGLILISSVQDEFLSELFSKPQPGRSVLEANQWFVSCSVPPKVMLSLGLIDASIWERVFLSVWLLKGWLSSRLKVFSSHLLQWSNVIYQLFAIAGLTSDSFIQIFPPHDGLLHWHWHLGPHVGRQQYCNRFPRQIPLLESRSSVHDLMMQCHTAGK